MKNVGIPLNFISILNSMGQKKAKYLALKDLANCIFIDWSSIEADF